MTFTSNILIFS